MRLLENKAKTGVPMRDPVLQKAMPERLLATIQGRGQRSVRNLSLQIDKRSAVNLGRRRASRMILAEINVCSESKFLMGLKAQH